MAVVKTLPPLEGVTSKAGLPLPHPRVLPGTVGPTPSQFAEHGPCQKATANQFRLLLHAAAYAILHRFRSTVLKGTQWERKTFAEIRLRLFKIAGRLKIMKTKVRLHLS